MLHRISGLARCCKRCFNSISAIANSDDMDTHSFRVFFEREGKRVSPWHDIALGNAENFHFVCEIPRGSCSKLEVLTDAENNPIAHDVDDNGVLRYLPYPCHWNYGLFPQTWESPHVPDKLFGLLGDADPLDCVELVVHGAPRRSIGEVGVVKPLGALGLIDCGEMDWKIVCVAADSPLAQELNDVDDLSRLLPSAVATLRNWLRHCKKNLGKEPNSFAHDGILDRRTALQVIHEANDMWRKKYS